MIGCNVINPDETIPTKVQLQPFELNVTTSQGSARTKITDVWVYANTNFLGVFSPPVEIDYLGEMDETLFSFRPGIRNNGILSDAIIYPMYTNYDITLPTTPGSNVTVDPVTHYKSNVVISLNADFEITNELVDNRDTIPGSFVVRTMTDPFEGNYCGEIVLNAEANFIEVGNAIPLIGLPVDGKKCFLEFQYKNDVEFSVGILGISLSGQKYSNLFYLVKPSDTWNMLYIELTDKLKESGFSAYEILFRSLYPSDATKPDLKIQLDNIKVVHL
jgi:hypothetical protein